MKYVVCNLAVNAVAITCVCCAAYLAIKRVDGWGWFLLVGMLCTTTLKMAGD